MNLVPRKIEELFKQYPLGSQRNLKSDARVLVKYFDPYGKGTWLVTEALPLKYRDWLLFGYFEDFGDWSWGYINVNGLERLNKDCFDEIAIDLYTPEISTVAELKRMRCGQYVSRPKHYQSKNCLEKNNLVYTAFN